MGMTLGLTAAARAHVPDQTPLSSTLMSSQTGISREGDVRRISGTFRSWRVVCDENARLHVRFCSLFGAGRDKAGRILVRAIVTTDDNGEPAALLHLPVSVGVGSPVEIAAVPAPTQDQPKTTPMETRRMDVLIENGKSRYQPQRLVVVSCDSKSCVTLWRLSAEQINTMNVGGTLHIRFSLMTGPAFGPDTTAKASPVPVEAVIDGVGFADAVNASMVEDGVLR